MDHISSRGPGRDVGHRHHHGTQAKKTAVGYQARARVMRDGQTYHGTETFDRRPATTAWIKQRERKLAKPGVIDHVKSGGSNLRKLSIATPGNPSRKSLAQKPGKKPSRWQQIGSRASSHGSRNIFTLTRCPARAGIACGAHSRHSRQALRGATHLPSSFAGSGSRSRRRPGSAPTMTQAKTPYRRIA